MSNTEKKQYLKISAYYETLITLINIDRDHDFLRRGLVQSSGGIASVGRGATINSPTLPLILRLNYLLRNTKQIRDRRAVCPCFQHLITTNTIILQIIIIPKNIAIIVVGAALEPEPIRKNPPYTQINSWCCSGKIGRKPSKTHTEIPLPQHEIWGRRRH